MSLVALAATDTRPLFRPVSSQFVALLRTLPAADWERPTIAGSWLVRDVVSHVIDIGLRRLSFHRDRMAPPPPPQPIASERDFVTFINTINRDWVMALRRCSPRVLTGLAEKAGAELSDFFESLPVDAPALFGVSWAGEQSSAGWFDVGREFTELWHHQMQVRLAVGAPPPDNDAVHLRAVLAIALRGLPYAYRGVAAETGDALLLEITGPAGGTWTLRRESTGWTLWQGDAGRAAARVRLSDDNAWRLLFNALRGEDAARAAYREGREDLVLPLLGARSIVV